MMNLEALQELSFTQVAEAYLDLRDEGKTIPIEQFAEAVPAHREKILKRLPVMQLLHDAMDPKGEVQKMDLNSISIDGCQIQEVIGRGASAVVYRAVQHAFDREVAIKVIAKQTKRNWIARLKVESRAMARLDHPNIVQPYSFIEQDEYDCLIMRYVDGYSLHDLMENHGDYRGMVIAAQLRSDWVVFASLAADVADALEHAHQNGIIHRDIKPANLLVDRNGKVWVTDFGLTKVVDDQSGLSRTGEVIGTLRYMAPEQMMGTCDERSDIFSLGRTLYALGGGRREAFEEVQEGSSQTLPDLRELNPEMPPELAAVVMKACRLNPDERFQTAAELRTVLKRFLAGRVPDRRRKTRSENGVYFRNWKMRSCLVGLTIAFAVATWFAVSEQGGGDDPLDANVRFANASGRSGSNADESGEDDSPIATPTSYTTETLLDKILEEGTTGVDPVVEEVVRRRIDQSATSLNLNTEETNVLHDQLGNLLEEDMLRENRIAELIDQYRQSPLSVATRVARITRIVDRSELSASEKRKGVETVRRLALLVAKEKVRVEEAIHFEKQLTYGRLMEAAEQSTLQIGRKRMSDWLWRVHQRIDREPPVDNMSREIEALFLGFDSKMGR